MTDTLIWQFGAHGNISRNIFERICIFFKSTDMHSPQRMNHTGVGDPIIFFFNLMPPAGQIFYLFYRIN